jgi:hypothetical protein
MTELQTDLAVETIETFKATLRGALLCPGDSGYDDARRLWNAMIDRRPACIVRCAGVAEYSFGLDDGTIR